MIEKIKSIIPVSTYNELPSVMEKFSINTAIRLSHFLGQASHESSDFARTIENLNYSESNLISLFGKHFTSETAKEYAHNPEKIANHLYASRMGNGGDGSGDGWKYRGRGYFQCTGKDNYISFSKVIPEDILANPDLVASKYPLLSAANFWNSHKLNSIADLGHDIDTITKITKIINGGTIGLDKRIIEFNKFYTLLSN